MKKVLNESVYLHTNLVWISLDDASWIKKRLAK